MNVPFVSLQQLCLGYSAALLQEIAYHHGCVKNGRKWNAKSSIDLEILLAIHKCITDLAS